jgi:5-(carboxyamino)imidazole ribonucleotide mutase
MLKAALIMGSKSDFDTVKGAIDTLHSFGVEADVRVISAHRTPDVAADFAKGARDNGYGVILCAAGKAAHLGGVIAAYTTLPVIGIPIKSSALDGMDALLAMVQMPPGIPVATMAIDGAVNAALFAVQVLAGAHPELVEKLEAHRRKQAQGVIDADKEVAALTKAREGLA